jgi:hypothetical protein
MRFRRKPVVRDVVDAIKLPDCYVFADAEGVMQKVPHAEFERDYEEITRAPRKVKKPKRERKGNSQQPGAGADAA